MGNFLFSAWSCSSTGKFPLYPITSGRPHRTLGPQKESSTMSSNSYVVASSSLASGKGQWGRTMHEGIQGASPVSLTCHDQEIPRWMISRTRSCNFVLVQSAQCTLECVKYVLGLGNKNLQVRRTRFIQGLGSESKSPYGLRRKSQNSRTWKGNNPASILCC